MIFLDVYNFDGGSMYYIAGVNILKPRGGVLNGLIVIKIRKHVEPTDAMIRSIALRKLKRKRLYRKAEQVSIESSESGRFCWL